jgi:nucleotide-binding universal stress UspA family protein
MNCPPNSASPIKSVLLATDFSEASQAAFQASLQLCLSFGASLYILNVFEYPNIVPPESGGQLLELESFYLEAESSLKGLIQDARLEGVETAGAVRAGVSHSCILDHAKSEFIDLVMLGTRSIHGFERLVFGSTAEAVLRKAECPVLTIGPRSFPRTFEMKPVDGVVVFATDFHVMTTQALTCAASFGTAMRLPLHCLHVLPRSAEDGTDKGFLPSIIKEALQHLAVGLDGEQAAPVCAVTYGSEISNAIVAYARDHHAKLIVLGVRRASLAASHVPAHIAYRVITEAPCPVLTIAYPPSLKEARVVGVQECESASSHLTTHSGTTVAYAVVEPR